MFAKREVYARAAKLQEIRRHGLNMVSCASRNVLSAARNGKDVSLANALVNHAQSLYLEALVDNGDDASFSGCRANITEVDRLCREAEALADIEHRTIPPMPDV
jgi:hypothetical protein